MAYLATPKSAPDVPIPASTSTVNVRVIDSLESLWLTGEGLFWTPEIKGFKGVEAPVFCFLISHGDRHVIFDLGIRRDWENYAPETAALIKKTTRIKIEKNLSEIIDSKSNETGVASSDVEAIVWSHNHFDHIGDPSTFPPSTELVVGPGFKDNYCPCYPTNPSGGLRDSDIEGRNFREIDIKKEGNGLKIGRFDAFDFFEDGSFYLLDAPGHSKGHLCAFARVTSSPDTFIFMGADAAHHPGILRPSEYLPLPSEIGGHPGSALLNSHPGKSATEPFLKLSKIAFPFHSDANKTLGKIQELDTVDNILVILCHDESLRGQIDLFPTSINNWKSKDVKEKTRWRFCTDFSGATS